MVEKLSV